MLLDRLLDNAGTEIAPFVVCEVRRGVRIEIPATDAALLHCVVRGNGMLWTAPDDAVPLAPASLALVPARTACFIEPLGGSSRRVSLDAAGTSDHIARLIAGAGEPGLVIASARLRSREQRGIGSFDELLSPIVVDLSDVDGALSLLERVEEEQRGRLAANRRMIELLIEQCLIHALRKLRNSGDGALPWLAGMRDAGLARALGAILRTPSAAHSLRSLAETADLPRAIFSTRFTESFGRAPLELLDQVRTREALRLLRTTDLSAASIAQRVGLPAHGELARELAALAALAPRWLASAPAAHEPKARPARKRPAASVARNRRSRAPDKAAVSMRRARGSGQAG